MTYAQFSDVVALVPQLSGSQALNDVTSIPTITQVNEYLTNTAAEIDAALASIGLQTPVTQPASFVTALLHLNAVGAAALLLLSIYPAETESDKAPLGTVFLEEYKMRLQEFYERLGIPSGVLIAEPVLAPSGFFLDTGSWGNDNAVPDAFGNLINSMPAVQKGMRW